MPEDAIWFSDFVFDCRSFTQRRIDGGDKRRRIPVPTELHHVGVFYGCVNPRLAVGKILAGSVSWRLIEADA